MAKDKIGFVGLGAMGFPMAKHLLQNGYEVHISKHSNKEASIKNIKELESLGAIVKESIADIPKEVSLIITILPSDKEVEDVFLNENFYNNINKDTIIIEMTSGSAETILKIEEYYSKKGIRILDAPVSGGVSGAEKGTLTIFGSGDKELLESLNEVLETFATNIYYIGKLGTGKSLKSVNQLMNALNTMALIEGLNIAKEQNIDLDIMYNVIKKSSGNSYALDRNFYKIVEEKFEGGFKLDLMRKDLKLAIDSVEGTSLPFANLAYEFYENARAYDDYDFSIISKLFIKNQG